MKPSRYLVEQEIVLADMVKQSGIDAQVSIDGNMLCILQGEDPMVGIVGFGNTAEECLADFQEAQLK